MKSLNSLDSTYKWLGSVVSGAELDNVLSAWIKIYSDYIEQPNDNIKFDPKDLEVINSKEVNKYNISVLVDRLHTSIQKRTDAMKQENPRFQIDKFALEQFILEKTGFKEIMDEVFKRGVVEALREYIDQLLVKDNISPECFSTVFSIICAHYIDNPEDYQHYVIDLLLKVWDQRIESCVTGEDIVVFIGRTQAGKSTLYNLLLGHKLQAEQLERYNNSQEPKLFLAEDNDQQGVEIGYGRGSITAFPNIYKDQNNKFIYVDLPGFGDNRGWCQSLVNGLGIQKLVNAAKSVRIINVSPAEDYKIVEGDKEYLTSKISSLLTDLSGFFTDISKIEELSFVITKASKDKIKSPFAKIKEFYEKYGYLKTYDSSEQTRDSQEVSDRMMALLNKLCSDKITFEYFHKPIRGKRVRHLVKGLLWEYKFDTQDEDRNNILSLIKKTPSLKLSVNACGLYYNAWSYDPPTADFINKYMNADMIVGLFRAALILYKSMENNTKTHFHNVIRNLKEDHIIHLMSAANENDVCLLFSLDIEVQSHIMQYINSIDERWISAAIVTILEKGNLSDLYKYLNDVHSRVDDLFKQKDKRQYYLAKLQERNLQLEFIQEIGVEQFVRYLEAMYSDIIQDHNDNNSKTDATVWMNNIFLQKFIPKLPDNVMPAIKEHKIGDQHFRLCFYLLKYPHLDINPQDDYGTVKHDVELHFSPLKDPDNIKIIDIFNPETLMKVVNNLDDSQLRRIRVDTDYYYIRNNHRIRIDGRIIGFGYLFAYLDIDKLVMLYKKHTANKNHGESSDFACAIYEEALEKDQRDDFYSKGTKLSDEILQ